MPYDPHGEFLLAERWWRRLVAYAPGRPNSIQITRPELAELIAEARLIPEPEDEHGLPADQA